MQLIQNGTQGGTSVPTKQTPSGTPGYANSGSPGTFTPTVFDPDMGNTLIAEIVAVILASGQSLSASNNAQLLAAIKLLTTGRLLNFQVFTSSGTYTPTTGMKNVIFEVQGGGGAGAGAGGAGAGNVSIGAPGTSGSYAKGEYSAATVGASQAVTVGIGGLGFSGTAGNNGGASSVGTLITAPPGIGGGLLNNVGVPTANGNGSQSSAAAGGNISSSVGVAGSPSLAFSTTLALGGQGGTSVFGPGNATTQINQAGAPASNYGAGGGGCVLNTSGGNAAGGAGFQGIVIAWEYS